MKKESLQSIENQLFLSSIFQALPKFQNRFVVWLAAVILLLTFSTQNANAQKMLLIEKANRAKTTKLYIGETLRFRMAGKENYWYTRRISDIIPESKTLILDNFLVKLDSISAIKVNRKGIWRVVGGALITFGASLTLATTVGKVVYRDKEVNAPKLYGIAAASLGTGLLLSTPKKLRLGKKNRLRIIEIKFPEPTTPLTPIKQ